MMMGQIVVMVLYAAVGTLSLALVAVGLWRIKMPISVMLGTLFIAVAAFAEMQVSYSKLSLSFHARLFVDNYYLVRLFFGLGIGLFVANRLRIEYKKRKEKKGLPSELAAKNVAAGHNHITMP